MGEGALPRLLVEFNGLEQSFSPEESPIEIGRNPKATIAVDGPFVSRSHASIVWRNAWFIEDMDSRNGVFVDGERIAAPIQIVRKTIVRLGHAVSGPPIQTRILRNSEPADDLDIPTRRAGSDPRGFEQTVRPRSQAVRPIVDEVPRTTLTRALSAPADMAKDGITIGRTLDNQIIVDDMLVSRLHARLVREQGALVLEDLHSVNGTFVNGARIARTTLHEDDIVTFGNRDYVASNGTLIPRVRPTADNGLTLEAIGFTVERNKQLLVDVSMSAPRGTLIGLIGPSGAGKSTLAKLVAGTNSPTAGLVRFEGRNLHADYDALRSRIGMVPQDEVLHRQLTVRQALAYAARLRLPADTTKQDRDLVVARVVGELGLTNHLETRVDKLSGGQRKRASVALELLTSPSLLILDEPTSGLDPALDRQVMTMLRELADADRVVIVVTHSLTHLDLCDEVLLLAPGGKTAYYGSPTGVGPALGSTDWAEIFDRTTKNPDRVFAEFRERNPQRPTAIEPPHYDPPTRPTPTRFGSQLMTLIRRQLSLTLADRAHLLILTLAPLAVGALALVVQGRFGFSVPTARAANPTEALEILVVLVVGSALMGLSLTFRDLVGERSIFHRERAVGLLPTAYIGSKVLVFGFFVTIQVIVMTSLVFLVKDGANHAGALLPSANVEVYVGLVANGFTAMMLGLVVSSLAKSTEQAVPLLVVAIMVLFVLADGVIDMTGRGPLTFVSWLVPSRWGLAATASSVDLTGLLTKALAGQTPPNKPDGLWAHTTGIWQLDISVLMLMSLALGLLALYRNRLPRRRRAEH